jgi:hypothetical protein
MSQGAWGWGRRLLAAAVMLASSSCGAPQAGACASDVDCGAETSCDEGQCRAPGMAAQADLRPMRVALEPTEDATVVSSWCCASEAYGRNDLLAVGRGERGATYRAYLAFDLSTLRPGSRITRAVLRLTDHPQWSLGVERIDVLAYPAARAWSEDRITWLVQPGGEGPPAAAVAIRPEHAGETALDVTSAVSGWLSGAQSNNGLVLRARRERARGRAVWSSSEASDARRRPRLELEIP